MRCAEMVQQSRSIPVRVRFAPSPTGVLHLGGAFVALANAAFARANGGAFVLRIDDTDQSRSRDEDAFGLLRLLRWLELDWDEGPVHQHGRDAVYAAALARLEQSEVVYPCFCGTSRLEELRAAQLAAGQPPRYDGRCRDLDPGEVARSLEAGAPHVLRYRVPDGVDVEVDDLLRGRVVVPAGSFGDPVLVRSDGSVGYLLASVADDVDLGITHVIRGEDHLTNTARQLLLFTELDAPVLPVFAHLPLLRGTDGRKLSKRDPLGTLDELCDEGFLPRTVRRYLAELLGHGAVDLCPPDGSRPAFDLLAVKPGAAPRVDRARLESLGREDMAELPLDELLVGTYATASERNEPLVRELAAAAPSQVALRGELRLVFDGPGIGDLTVVLPMALPDAAARAAAEAALEVCVQHLRVDIDSGPRGGEDAHWALPFLDRTRTQAQAAGMSVGQLLRPLRLALTGETSGPRLELVLAAVGAREALRRVHAAREVLEELRVGSGAVGG
jgi:glutamyl-tRNA synthetase